MGKETVWEGEEEKPAKHRKRMKAGKENVVLLLNSKATYSDRSQSTCNGPSHAKPIAIATKRARLFAARYFFF